MDLKLGWLRKNEIKEASNIEWYSAERFWGERDFGLIFKHSNPRVVVPLVCRIEDTPKNEKLIGYCIYRKTKNSYNVLNMVVHPEHRRQGVGTLFIKNLMFNIYKGKRSHIRVRIRDSAHGVPHHFLASFGFNVSRLVPNFYCMLDKVGNEIGKQDAMEYYVRVR